MEEPGAPGAARDGRVALALAGVVAALVAHGLLLLPEAIWTRDHLDFYLRTHQYARELVAGQWPQDLPDAVAGGGHAFPRFYPPLAHLAAALLFLPTQDVILASHLALLLAVVAAALGMHALAVEATGDRLAAAASAIAYVAAPYVAVLLYGRGAFAEAWSLAWYPWLALGVLRVARGHVLPTWWPVAVGAALLTHAVMALWTLPVLGAIALLGARDTRARLDVVLASVFGTGLAAFYLLPARWYMPEVRVVLPEVMWSSAEEVARNAARFAVPAWLVAVELAVLGAAWLHGLVTGRRDGTWRLLLVAGALCVAYTLLSSAPAAVWSVVPAPLLYIQFPFRLHGPATFLACLALGALVARLSRPGMRWAVVALAALAAVAGGVGRQVPRPPAPVRHSDVMSRLESRYADLGLTVVGEYLPRESDPPALAARIRALRDSLEGRRMLRRDGRVLRRDLDAGADGWAALPLVAYDFHAVHDQSGRALATRSDGGQLAAAVNPSVRTIVVTRRSPGPLTLGWCASLLALVGVALRARREEPAG